MSIKNTQALLCIIGILLVVRAAWRFMGRTGLGFEIDLLIYLLFVGLSLYYTYIKIIHRSNGETPIGLILTGLASGLGIGLSTIMLIVSIGFSYHVKQTEILLGAIDSLSEINEMLTDRCGSDCENMTFKPENQ